MHKKKGERVITRTVSKNDQFDPWGRQANHLDLLYEPYTILWLDSIWTSALPWYQSEKSFRADFSLLTDANFLESSNSGSVHTRRVLVRGVVVL